MTLKEFLEKVDVDVSTNKSPLGNQLKADLSLEEHFIDFNKDVSSLTDEDKYQIGRSLILYHVKRRVFFRDDLIGLINKSTEYALQNSITLKEDIINDLKNYINKFNL